MNPSEATHPTDDLTPNTEKAGTTSHGAQAERSRRRKAAESCKRSKWHAGVKWIVRSTLRLPALVEWMAGGFASGFGPYPAAEIGATAAVIAVRAIWLAPLPAVTIVVKGNLAHPARQRWDKVRLHFLDVGCAGVPVRDLICLPRVGEDNDITIHVWPAENPVDTTSGVVGGGYAGAGHQLRPNLNTSDVNNESGNNGHRSFAGRPWRASAPPRVVLASEEEDDLV